MHTHTHTLRVNVYIDMEKPWHPFEHHLQRINFPHLCECSEAKSHESLYFMVKNRGW